MRITSLGADSLSSQVMAASNEIKNFEENIRVMIGEIESGADAKEVSERASLLEDEQHTSHYETKAIPIPLNSNLRRTLTK